ncbi:hypothetical protein NPIL_293481 [Nephila pilipes]|uniref:Uncharacterized protein n=1 Tax=Nephila pilipes TaxID=299642 RepID=A0A8X6NYV5_NEPPI|nr:hypothetical protein NPIL_293481 [Nephila pilipes]
MSPKSFDDIIDPIWNRWMQSKCLALLGGLLGLTISICCFSLLPTILKLPRYKATTLVCAFAGIVCLIMCLSACRQFYRLTSTLSIDELQEPVNHAESGVNLNESICIEMDPSFCSTCSGNTDASTKTSDISCASYSSVQEISMSRSVSSEKTNSCASNWENNRSSDSQNNSAFIQFLPSISTRMMQNARENTRQREISSNHSEQITRNKACSISKLVLSNTGSSKISSYSRKDSLNSFEKTEASSSFSPSFLETDTSSLSGILSFPETDYSSRSSTFSSAGADTSSLSGILSFPETDFSRTSSTISSAGAETSS